MVIYEAETYRDFVKDRVYQENRPRGGLRALAEALKCHPTYLSQVVRGLSHFSNEQAIAFCRYRNYSLTRPTFSWILSTATVREIPRRATIFVSELKSRWPSGCVWKSAGNFRRI